MARSICAMRSDRFGGLQRSEVVVVVVSRRAPRLSLGLVSSQAPQHYSVASFWK
jgi:hypothetical protein